MSAVTVDRGKLALASRGRLRRIQALRVHRGRRLAARDSRASKAACISRRAPSTTTCGVITENASNRKRMMEKRMRKLVSMRPDLPKANVFGDRSAGASAFIGYGSNRGPITEAQDRLAAAGIATRFLQLRTLWPFPEDEVRDVHRNARSHLHRREQLHRAAGAPHPLRRPAAAQHASACSNTTGGRSVRSRSSKRCSGVDAKALPAQLDRGGVSNMTE